MKKQYKQRLFWSRASQNTFIKMYYIWHKRTKIKMDVIEVDIKGLHSRTHFQCTPEEAIEIIWGLSKCVWKFLVEFRPYRKWRKMGEYFKKEKSK